MLPSLSELTPIVLYGVNSLRLGSLHSFLVKDYCRQIYKHFLCIIFISNSCIVCNMRNPLTFQLKFKQRDKWIYHCIKIIIRPTYKAAVVYGLIKFISIIYMNLYQVFLFAVFYHKMLIKKWRHPSVNFKLITIKTYEIIRFVSWIPKKILYN